MIRHLLLMIAPLSAIAQINCPPANAVQSVSLKPTPTSHIDVVRQEDGSYTGFEVTDAPPYRVITATPNFERQFVRCGSGALPVSLPAAPAGENPAGAGSQILASASFKGNLTFVARISDDRSAVYFQLFDTRHNLLSESTFTSVVPRPGGLGGSAADHFFSAALADLNLDGTVDLLVVFGTPLTSSYTDGGVFTFLGNGDGTFQPGQRQVLTNRGMLPAAQTVAAGDINGDGKPDIVLGAPFGGALTIALGKGDGTFHPETLKVFVPSAFSDFISVAITDLNGDGKADLVVAPCRDAQYEWVVGVAPGNGDGSFGETTLYPTLAQSAPVPAAVAAGDVDGDGAADIATASGTIWFGNGRGVFTSRQDYGLKATGSVMLFDFDRDGKTDVVYGNGNAGFLSATQPAPALSVLPGAILQKPELSVVSAASFAAGALAPESMASAFGQGIAAAATSASAPLPTSLSGITVTVEDTTGTSRPAPLLFVSPGQVNFIVPAGTAIGLASITIGGTLSGKALTAHVQIAEVAPALFSAGQQIAAAIVVQVAPGGTQTILPAFTVQEGNVTPVPIDVSQPGQTFLVLFGTGFRRATTGSVAVNVQGTGVPVTYAGPQGTYAGLDQVNVLLPPELAGSGTARVSLSIAGSRSNAVLVMIR